MEGKRTRAFTIIELLVVVSIIALLVGILLPAIGKAREQAQLTKSMANMRNLGTAYTTYEAEWNDRQFTLIDDNIGRYGDTPQSAFPNYHTAHGGCPGVGAVGCHPPCLLGWGTQSGLWGYWQNHPGNWVTVEPFRFPGYGGQDGFGSFRLQNAKQFNTYLTGRFYDPVWYAPKDRAVLAVAEEGLESPAEFWQNIQVCNTSYVSSPAAMFSPDVLGKENDFYLNPFEKDAGLRSPNVGMCKFPELKTRMLEHHWLQGTRADCNPSMGGGYAGCQPYFFNGAYESAPVTLFFDGHIELLGTRENVTADQMLMGQTGGDHGLWSRNTPYGEDGYFSDVAYDWTTTSFHIFTTDGIKGRDKLGN